MIARLGSEIAALRRWEVLRGPNIYLGLHPRNLKLLDFLDFVGSRSLPKTDSD